MGSALSVTPDERHTASGIEPGGEEERRLLYERRRNVRELARSKDVDGLIRDALDRASPGGEAYRAVTVRAIAKIGGDEAVKFLIGLLDPPDPQEGVRAVAARDLARRYASDPRVVRTLAAALHDDGPGVRS